jgi:hypothetical protein
MDENKELVEQAVVLDEIATQLTESTEKYIDQSHQEILDSAVASLGAIATVLCSSRFRE